MSIKNIIDSIKNRQISESEKNLAKYVAGVKISSEDGGSVYAEIASVYFQSNSEMMRRYKLFLEELREEVRELNLKEKILTAGS